ncbi:MAG: HAD hydrolase-like protein [Cyanobacteria bacterium P01_A01_bin.84]
MSTDKPSILALDFDGVICDGLIEYFQVAWRTYSQVWQTYTNTPPDGLAEKFYPLRPVIETGWEMPVLIKALVEDIPESKIYQEWHSLSQQIVERDNLDSKDIAQKLDNTRDNWINTNLDDWLSLHRFYPGVVEKLQSSMISPVELYIITTKEGRFAKQLLQKAGVNIEADKIFGKEVKRPKYETIQELIEKHQTSPENVWFVEDRLKTLQLVKKQSDLSSIKLFLADWGYNTASERKEAQQDERVKLLSLSGFADDFSNW